MKYYRQGPQNLSVKQLLAKKKNSISAKKDKEGHISKHMSFKDRVSKSEKFDRKDLPHSKSFVVQEDKPKPDEIVVPKVESKPEPKKILSW